MTENRSSRAAIVTLSLAAAVSALLLTPTAGRAEQFVLFDVPFTFTNKDADTSTPKREVVASKSHDEPFEKGTLPFAIGRKAVGKFSL